MFGAVLHDEELCKGVLERLLKIKVSKIEYPEFQKSIKTGYDVHGIRLDVYATDSDTVYDIEMQNKVDKFLGKRMRFYQSMIDSDFLHAGNKYENLKDSIILFICKNDPFEKGLQQYSFKSFCCEDKSFCLNDNCQKVIYNASKFREEKDPNLRAFLHFIYTNEATDDFTDALDKKVESVKRNEAFQSEYMMLNIALMEAKSEARLEGLEEGRIEGQEESKILIAKNLLKMNFTYEQISQATNLSLEQIKKLAEE